MDPDAAHVRESAAEGAQPSRSVRTNHVGTSREADMDPLSIPFAEYRKLHYPPIVVPPARRVQQGDGDDDEEGDIPLAHAQDAILIVLFYIMCSGAIVLGTTGASIEIYFNWAVNQTQDTQDFGESTMLLNTNLFVLCVMMGVVLSTIAAVSYPLQSGGRAKRRMYLVKGFLFVQAVACCMWPSFVLLNLVLDRVLYLTVFCYVSGLLHGIGLGYVSMVMCRALEVSGKDRSFRTSYMVIATPVTFIPLFQMLLVALMQAFTANVALQFLASVITLLCVVFPVGMTYLLHMKPYVFSHEVKVSEYDTLLDDHNNDEHVPPVGIVLGVFSSYSAVCIMCLSLASGLGAFEFVFHLHTSLQFFSSDASWLGPVLDSFLVQGAMLACILVGLASRNAKRLHPWLGHVQWIYRAMMALSFTLTTAFVLSDYFESTIAETLLALLMPVIVTASNASAIALAPFVFRGRQLTIVCAIAFGVLYFGSNFLPLDHSPPYQLQLYIGGVQCAAFLLTAFTPEKFDVFRPQYAQVLNVFAIARGALVVIVTMLALLVLIVMAGYYGWYI